MRTASGLIYQNGKFSEGSLSFSKGRMNISRQLNESAEIHGLILPQTVNCHTHLGDAFIIRPEKCSVEELVAPPNGLKHRMLRTVGQEEQVSSMREAISRMASAGSSHFIDFRENGLEGTRRLLIASLGSGVRPIILGRPDSSDVDEISALLSVADGIGLSAISDIEFDFARQLADHAHQTDKIFAVHASEAKRENMDLILDLEPDLLVHLVHSDISDIRDCASLDVPVAVCPSSNAFFGLKPPVRQLLDEGVRVCLGSDNAMLAEPNIIEEMRSLRRMFPLSELSDEEIVDLGFNEGRKVLNSLPGLGDAIAEETDFFVLETQADEPFRRILEARTEMIHPFTRSDIP